MAKLFNLARMSTATTGTGTITLGSAVTGFLSFASAGVSNGDYVTYAIEDGSHREIGRGVYTSSGTTLTRSVIKSTNSNAAINLSGTAHVFVTASAEDLDTFGLPVTHFGAVGDNSTDCTSAFSGAFTAAASLGYRRVFVPKGIYRVTSGSLTLPAYIELVGESREGSIIRTTSATGDVLVLGGSRVLVSNLTFDASVTRSSGRYIYASSAAASIAECSRLNLIAPAVGISSSSTLLRLYDIDIQAPIASTGIGVEITDGFVVNMQRVVVAGNPAARNFANLYITNVHDAYAIECQFLSGGHNINIAPGNGQFVGLFSMTGGGCDDCPSSASIRVVPTGTGYVNNIHLAMPWNYGSPNFQLNGSFGAGINTASICDTLMPAPAAVTGIGISATSVTNLIISRNKIGGHATAVTAIDCSKVMINGNTIGPTGPYGINTTGISLSGTTDKVVIIGNELDGNTTPISNSSSGTDITIIGNGGYDVHEMEGELRLGTAGTNSASVVTVGGTQTLTSKTLTSPAITTGITPTSNDGAALGTTALSFSDVFLASGGVINWNSGTYTITQSGTTLAFSGNVTLGSLTMSGNLSIGADLVKTSATSYFAAYGGSAFNNGGGIVAYGGSHATTPNQVWIVNNGFQTRILVEQGGAVKFPGITTTASAANAFLDSGASNNLLRSTSSLAYKDNVEAIDPSVAARVLELEPIWYRSKAAADRPDWSWYGLGAEQVAEIDPRLVHWGYHDDDHEEVVVPHTVNVPTTNKDGEAVIEQKTVMTKQRNLKAGAVKKPDGVMYDRLGVLMLAWLKHQRIPERLTAIEQALGEFYERVSKP